MPIFSFLPERYPRMRIAPYDWNHTGCKYIFLSSRAYATIISEVLRNGENETGGVFLGNAYHKIWFVTDCIDPGLNTVHSPAAFHLDVNYVNRITERVRNYYQFPLTFLGFWHRHPGSLDTFSSTDEQTIRSNLRGCPHGILSMLVNIDPELRMTFYYCYGETLMVIPYDQGDEYFPEELLAYASPEELIARSRTPNLRVKPKKRMDPNRMPRHIQLPDAAQDRIMSARARYTAYPTPQTRSQIQSQTRPQSQIQSQTRSQVQSQTRPQSQIQSQTRSQIQSQTRPQSQIQPQTRSQIQPQTRTQSQIQPQTRSQIQPQTRTQSQIQPQTRSQIQSQSRTQTPSANQNSSQSVTDGQTQIQAAVVRHTQSNGENEIQAAVVTIKRTNGAENNNRNQEVKNTDANNQSSSASTSSGF